MNNPSWALRAILLVSGAAASFQTVAQTLPDAGRVIQEMRSPTQPRKDDTEFVIQASPLSSVVPGGAKVTLRSVRFSGNTRFDDATLQSLIAPALGESLDMAGLQALANRVSRFYREQGYTFARAYLPPQRMGDGQLAIAVIEGRYGTVTATSEKNPRLARRAQRFLAPLQPGAVIQASLLERTVLILSDQPDVSVSPVLRPGDEVGTGDLEVRVRREPLVSGAVSVDNHGNRYSGRYRGQLGLNVNGPFMLGDRIDFTAVLSDEDLWLGKLGYELPLGVSGLRGEVSYSQTRYQLGDEFAELDYYGIAKVTSLGLSYPLMRSQRRNLSLSATYQHKDLSDDYRAADVHQQKSSDSLPVALQFDNRDDWLGGGITYGAFTVTPGHLSLDTPEQREVDRLTANAAGDYTLFNLDLARLQRLTDSLSLYARFAGQLADSNLDSSEGFVLGGANGVRAYPQGEAFGDEGWLTQLEMRYRYQSVEPYLFYDAGRTSANHSPWESVDNTRSLSGGGVGMRVYRGAFSANASLAWANTGGEPQSDTRDETPRAWFQANYRF